MKGVVIVGSAPSTMKQASAFFGDDYEIWSLNCLYLLFPEIMPYITRWFDIHRENDVVAYERDEYKILDKYDFPVYTVKEGMCKNCVAYPIKEIIVEFGTYFTNTISYMIALAIKEKFKEIHLYGIDMSHTAEYGEQRPSCEYFVGLARGMGIKVMIPVASDLLKTARLYGFEGIDKLAGKIRSDLDRAKLDIETLEKAVQNSRDERMTLMGAIGSDLDTPEKKEKAENRIKVLLHGEIANNNTMSFLNGTKHTLEHFRTNWDCNI